MCSLHAADGVAQSGAYPSGEVLAACDGVELLDVHDGASELFAQLLCQFEAILDAQLEADALDVGNAVRVAFALLLAHVQRVGRRATRISAIRRSVIQTALSTRVLKSTVHERECAPAGLVENVAVDVLTVEAERVADAEERGARVGRDGSLTRFRNARAHLLPAAQLHRRLFLRHRYLSCTHQREQLLS